MASLSSRVFCCAGFLVAVPTRNTHWQIRAAHDLGTLRIVGLEALVVAARDLCPLSGKPGHQGIFNRRGSGAVRQIQRGEYPHGADPRRSAGIRSRTTTSWPAAVAGAQALAKGRDSAAFARGRIVHVS